MFSSSIYFMQRSLAIYKYEIKKNLSEAFQFRFPFGIKGKVEWKWEEREQRPDRENKPSELI